MIRENLIKANIKTFCKVLSESKYIDFWAMNIIIYETKYKLVNTHTYMF